MNRPHGGGRRRRLFGLLAGLSITAGLLAGGSAVGFGRNRHDLHRGRRRLRLSGGDGGQATLASLKNPEGVAATPDGGFLVADKENNRIRLVAPDGTISTVAGTGTEGYNGDGIAATAAKVAKPEGVAALPDGGFLIADTNNQLIRRVTPLGTIETVAGTGSTGYTGDGGDATLAKIDHPRAAVPTPDGGFLIADTGNRVIRRVVRRRARSRPSPATGADGSTATAALPRSRPSASPDDVAPTAGRRLPDRRLQEARRAPRCAGRHDLDRRRRQLPERLDRRRRSCSDALLDTPADVEVLWDGGFLIADHDRDQRPPRACGRHDRELRRHGQQRLRRRRRPRDRRRAPPAARAQRHGTEATS